MIKLSTYLIKYKDQVYEYNKEEIPTYFDINFSEKNKEYIFYQKILNKEFNIFNSIVSLPFSNIIHLTIIKWLNNNIKMGTIFRTFSNNLEQPGIAINYKLCNSLQQHIRKESIYKSLDTTNIILPLSNTYKIHINIKLKYLFFVINKILNNSKKFIINGKPLFSFLKIHTDFYNFTILREENSILNDEKILYYPNIVFYQYEDTDQEITKLCFQKLVKVLLKLFPDNLQISSKIYSKYSLRLNDNIYLQTGDAIAKIKQSDEYTIPVEYKKILESCSLKKNKLVKKLSNHILCKYVDKKWIPNDLNSINYLVKKNNNSINQIFIDIGLKPFFNL